MGMTSRQERQKEWQRSFILERAASLFAEQGFNDTTMEQIAEAAEFSKGALYNYFESKEDLFLSMVEHGLESMDGMLEEVAGGEEGFQEKLSEFVHRYLGFFETEKSVFRVVHTEGSSLAFSSPKTLGDKMRVHFRDFVDGVARLVREGQEEGVVAPDEEPRLTAMVILSVLRGYMFYWILQDRESPDPSQADGAVRHVRRLLGIPFGDGSQGGEEAA